MMFEESKTFGGGGNNLHRSSSQNKGSDSLTTKTKVAVKSKISTMMIQGGSKSS
jgi:hypothetical protein